jgi:O-antigen ligase
MYAVLIYMISFVLLLKITQTVRDVERLLVALCVAAAGLAMAVLFTYSGGRAHVNDNFDPNDLAYGLVTAFPIIRALAVTTKRKLLLHGLTVAVIVAILLTGSRGGTIGLCLVLLLLVAYPLGFTRNGELRGFRAGRFVAVIAVIAALGGALWGYLPQESRTQLATLVDLEHDYNAGSSAGSRTAIWSRDLDEVWKRPIGYGIGTSLFVNGRAGGGYHVAHNSFIQALVELGVQGFFVFVVCYLVAFRELGKVSRLGVRTALQGDRATAALYARALRIALAGNIVTAFFLSQDYAELLWILLAICTALVRISLAGTAPAAAPAP